MIFEELKKEAKFISLQNFLLDVQEVAKTSHDSITGKIIFDMCEDYLNQLKKEEEV